MTVATHRSQMTCECAVSIVELDFPQLVSSLDQHSLKGLLWIWWFPIKIGLPPNHPL